MSHQGSFLAATIFSCIDGVLEEVKILIVSDEFRNNSYECTNEVCYRISIAYYYVKIAYILAWFVVNILMLIIYIKQITPVEKDVEKLIKDQLTEIFEQKYQDSQNAELQEEKRQKEFGK